MIEVSLLGSEVKKSDGTWLGGKIICLPDSGEIVDNEIKKLIASEKTFEDSLAELHINWDVCLESSRAISQGYFREDRGTASASTTLHPYRCRTSIYAYENPVLYICPAGIKMQCLYYGAAEAAGTGTATTYTGKYSGWSRFAYLPALTYVGVNFKKDDDSLVVPADIKGKYYSYKGQSYNRVTEITEDVTDEQYASAKAVKDYADAIYDAAKDYSDTNKRTADDSLADELLSTRFVSVNNRTINQGLFLNSSGTASSTAALHSYRCRTSIYAYASPRTYICAKGYEMQMLYYGPAEQAGLGDAANYTGEHTEWSRVITFDALTYVGINFRRVDGGTIEPAELSGKFFTLNETRTTEINVASTDTQVPSAKAVKDYIDSAILGCIEFPLYYRDYILGKIAEINALSDDADKEYTGAGHSISCGDAFVFITDTHWTGSDNLNNTGYSPAFAEKLLDETDARFVIHGGDAYNKADNGQNALTYIRTFKNAFKTVWDKMFCVVGNHEYNNPSASTSAADLDNTLVAKQVYGILCKDKEDRYIAVDDMGDYVFDNIAQKIRYICLGCTFKASIAYSQRHFVLDQLTKIPNGYTVVLISHRFLDKDSGTWIVNSAYQNIAKALDAIADKSQEQSITFDNVTYNYSAVNANVACVLCGHLHGDASLISAAGVPYIMTTTDNLHKQSTSNALERAAGTVTEQAFDYVRIDTIGRKINLVRIGAGTNRTFTY